MSHSLPPPPNDDRSSSSRAGVLLALAPALYRTARRLTRGVDDASAVTVEAVRAVWAGHATPSRSEAFGALWRALRHLWQEQGYVVRRPWAGEPGSMLAGRLGGEEDDLDRLFMSRLDASPDVDVALRTLSERERFVVLMVDVEEGSREEAADALEIDAAKVGALLLGARVQIFVSLADYAHRSTGLDDVTR